jgi:iron(III) transport system permease protein
VPFTRPTTPTFDWLRLAWLASFAWLVYFVALPCGYMLVDSITDDGFTLAHFADFAADPKLRAATVNSMLVATGVACLSVVVGVPLAFGYALTAMPGRRLLQATIIVSLISPDFLIAMAYIALAGPNAGYLNYAIRDLFGLADVSGPLDIFSMWGLVLTALPHGVAYVFLTLAPALRNLDPALDEAARLQGATGQRALWDITLPLVRPAVLAGALLAFCGSLAMFGPPHLLRLNVLTISIREALVRLDFKAASATSIVLLALSLVALLLLRLATRRGERFRTIGGKSFAHRVLPTSRATRVALVSLAVAYAIAALLLPYGAMLVISFMKSVGHGLAATNWTLDNYLVVLQDDGVQRAARSSVLLAAGSATLVVAMGFLAAYVIVRTRYAGKTLMEGLSVLPVALPGTALAIALAILYLNWPLNSLALYGSFGILFVAYVTRFVSFGVRTNQASLVQLAPELEDASRICGAGMPATLAFVTAPLMRTTLAYAWILVFILALPELSASIILKGIHTQTISTALLDIWNGNGGLAMACAFGMLIFAAVCLLLLGANAVTRKGPRLSLGGV